ncbi:hypothetical protein AB0M36_16375 [Actinoplanes sp. NPDC051346]|uniref:hypothetical protein n=1 Tax=Actinoplanes sp. NPDC051346 TaxID=3155048 RepID=UPI003416AD66
MNPYNGCRSYGSSAVRDIDIEVVKRSTTVAGFVPIAKRWPVEQIDGTPMLHRRLPVRPRDHTCHLSVQQTPWPG